VLEGDLTDFTLPDVLRLLAFTSKTGRLTLDDGVRRGRVELLDGRVRDASADAARLPLARRILGAGLVDGADVLAMLDGRDQLPTDLELARALVEAGTADVGTLAHLLREQTVDAAFDLLRWSTGAFRFAANPDAAATTGVLELSVPVDELLEEATARLESWTALADRTGDLDGVVTIARPDRGAGERAEVALPPDGWGLLALVDGHRTLADLVALSGQGEFRTRQSLSALLDEGVVRVGRGQEAGPLERLLRDQAALAERERDLAATDAGGPRPAVDLHDHDREPAPMPEPGPGPEPAVEDAPPAEAPEAPEPAAETPEPVAEAPEPVADAPDAPAAADVRQLRTKVRSERLRTDPTVDEDLVTRLIEGVEGL
jgi:hypothetical protein